MIIRIMRLAGLGLMLALGTMTAQAGIISVLFDFDDPDWSGSASYNDTTGQAWTSDPTLTAYVLTSMTISLSGVATWDESEWCAGCVPPDLGIVVDSVGRAALFGRADDTVSGFHFFNGIGSASNGLISSSEIIGYVPDEVRGTYTSVRVPVPEPPTLALLALGLIGLGFARRRRT